MNVGCKKLLHKFGMVKFKNESQALRKICSIIRIVDKTVWPKLGTWHVAIKNNMIRICTYLF